MRVFGQGLPEVTVSRSSPGTWYLLMGATSTGKRVMLICGTGGYMYTVVKTVSGTNSGKYGGRVKEKTYADPERAFGKESRGSTAALQTAYSRYSTRVGGQTCIRREFRELPPGRVGLQHVTSKYPPPCISN
eukprot:5818069-Pyramimonas_sp.AAC.1